GGAAPQDGGKDRQRADRDGEEREPAPGAGAGGRGRGLGRGIRDPLRSVPEGHSILSPFGNPADSGSSVALRPRLATGVLFRGTSDRGPTVPTTPDCRM